ncbi:MAG: hypothetical protein K2N51_20860 [Lachnospiraceae bacterium]|nr:hypothetical protein [Lachnospiraceae bacterium]
MSNEKDSTFKELDEIVQEAVRRYLENTKECVDDMKMANLSSQKGYILGVIEVLNSYSQMPTYCDCASSLLEYLPEKENLEKVKEEAEKSLSEIQINYVDEHTFVPRDVIADNIINYFENCKCSFSDAWEVTKIVRDRLHTQAYKEQIK